MRRTGLFYDRDELMMVYYYPQAIHFTRSHWHWTCICIMCKDSSDCIRLIVKVTVSVPINDVSLHIKGVVMDNIIYIFVIIGTICVNPLSDKNC